MAGPLTYWRTMRHLKPVQIYGRIWFRCSRPRVDTRAAPPTRSAPQGRWVAPARRRPSLVGPRRFQFLNETHDLAAVGWDDPALTRLWRYNVHYFDDLNAEHATERADWHRALLRQWVSDNAPGTGTAWEPYPTSLRIVNWIKWALAGNTLPAECVHSLAIQTRWLTSRLEHHLLGNHLLANAKALVFAGLFFDGHEADAWAQEGLRILWRQLGEQILSDGGHFELSPMYHAIVLEDLEDLCNIAGVFSEHIPTRWKHAVEEWPQRTALMRGWLAAMCHPDGEISFFNDAAFGIAPAPLELDEYAVRLALPVFSVPTKPVTRLAESGYLRVEHGAAVALLDVAFVGPDYLPAHAHADTLSFELSLFGHRVFVNSGISRYDGAGERLRQRGTSAHNTVVVDGQDSSEVWGSFRMARRARPTGLQVEHGGSVVVRCAHDGYRRLPSGVEHRRQWTVTDHGLVVDDRVVGVFGRAEARFHVHPAIQLREVPRGSGAGAVTLLLPSGESVHVSIEAAGFRTERTSWHPEFGRAEPNYCLVAELGAAGARTRISWDAAP